jgi:hypothetical protein
MRTFGADVHVCPLVGFSDARHFYQRASRIGERPGVFWTNQVCFRGLHCPATRRLLTRVAVGMAV